MNSFGTPDAAIRYRISLLEADAPKLNKPMLLVYVLAANGVALIYAENAAPTTGTVVNDTMSAARVAVAPAVIISDDP